MMFVALLFVVPFVVAQQDSSFVPSNQHPPQVDVPGGTSQVGGQINIQPASGALPPVDPNNPQANQQQSNSGPSQGQIPSALFNNQGGQVNPGQPAQPPLSPSDPNNPQQPNPQQPDQQQPDQQGGATFPNQPNLETTSPTSIENGQQPSGSEHGQQPASLENGQASAGDQGASSTQELFGTQPPNHDSSSSMQTSNQNALDHSQEHMNQATEGFTGQPANSSVNVIVSGLVLLFAALIGML
uniref:Uncharacterized protein n=1 Tax=Plectus sambesii TaxID=2011161 RepID=A0A914XE96_9BILA